MGETLCITEPYVSALKFEANDRGLEMDLLIQGILSTCLR